MDTFWIFLVCLGLYSTKPILGQSEFEVQLVVPKYVERGASATLKCKHNVRPEILFKVTWLKVDRGKFFEFINGRNPPFRNFSVEGAELDWRSSNETQVTLKNVDFNATGQYYCEVSTDTPIYTKASADEIMNVFLPQPGPPIIKFRKRTPFAIGERLFALCNTTRARPAPTITWLINGKKVDPQFVRTHHIRANRSQQRLQQQQQQQLLRQDLYQQYLQQSAQQYHYPHLDRYDKSLRWSGGRVDDEFATHAAHYHDGHYHAISLQNNPFSSLANMHDVHEVQHRSYDKNKHFEMKKHLEMKKQLEQMRHHEQMKHRSSSNRKYRRHVNENAIGILRSTLKSGVFGPEAPNMSSALGIPPNAGHMKQLAAGYNHPLEHPGGGKGVAMAAAAFEEARRQRDAARAREAAQQPEGTYSLSQLNIVLTEQHVGTNGRVEITCLSTIPAAVDEGEQYADYKTYSVKVEVERPEVAANSTPAPSIGMAALGNGAGGVEDGYSSATESAAPPYVLLSSECLLFGCLIGCLLQRVLLLMFDY